MLEDNKFENSFTKWKHTKQIIIKIHEVVEKFQKLKMNKMEKGYAIFVDSFTSSSDFYNVGDDSSSDEGANR